MELSTNESERERFQQLTTRTKNHFDANKTHTTKKIISKIRADGKTEKEASGKESFMRASERKKHTQNQSGSGGGKQFQIIISSFFPRPTGGGGAEPLRFHRNTSFFLFVLVFFF